MNLIKNQITSQNVSIPYTLFCPDTADTPLPLVVCFHSEEERGGDNISHLGASSGWNTLTAPAFQKKRPCFVLAPQCPDGRIWNELSVETPVTDLIFSVAQSGDYPIDTNLIYAVGSSLGGMAAWTMVSHRPTFFTAALPVSGCGDPYAVRNAKFVPIWAFHCENDQVIPVSTAHSFEGATYLAGSRRMVNSLCLAGSEKAYYTEYDPDEVFRLNLSSPHHLYEAVYANEQVWDWLFSQTRKSRLTVQYVMPKVWRIDDFFRATCYLVEGSEKALLIDTGVGDCDLPAFVKTLTNLPVEVAITHPHFDHYQHAGAFDTVYFHKDDIEKFSPLPGSTPEHQPKIIPIEDGSRIDLGDGYLIETAFLGGHTKNSVVFIDPKHKIVYTGDAIGSGEIVLMITQPEVVMDYVAEYRKNLLAFLTRKPDLHDYTFFGGHFIQENSCDDRIQEDCLNGTSHYFNPISWEVVEDMVVLCDMVLNGDITEKQVFEDQRCYYKSAGMVFAFRDV